MITLDVAAAHREFERWRNAIALASGKAIVGGGAVRDALLGRTARDIDVFHTDKLTDTDFLKPVLPIEGNTQYHSIEVFNSEASGIDFIWIGEGFEINDYVADHFRCNLSKIYFDGEMIHMTLDFIEALQTKTLRFKEGTSPEYIEKICKKYPEYAVGDPSASP